MSHGESGHVHDVNGFGELGRNKGPGISWSHERQGVCAECAESECDEVHARNEWCGVHQ